MDTNNKTISINETISVQATLKVKSRRYLSINHIQAAALFSRNCYRIEKEYDGIFSNEIYIDHDSFVIAALLSAVSFLEATINEFLADSLDSPDGEIVGSLDNTTKTLLANMWKNNVIEKLGILEKFQISLSIARKDQFDKGNPIYQNADDLIMLRNALVHYKPAWIEASQDLKTAHKLEKRLRKKFLLNPLMGAGNPFYPDKCLSHGCTQWAVESSMKFVEDFYSRLGMSFPFNFILKTS